MKTIFLKSFDKAYKKLSPLKQKQAGKIIEKLVYYLKESISPLPKGLGIERRKGGYGYCRIDIYLRVLFKSAIGKDYSVRLDEPSSMEYNKLTYYCASGGTADAPA